ncbi:hypothetical protein SAMN05428988_0583 [Chitinophaga sp. YR573]|uniref:hypothetical protein n=1 Tax=Chitinophaga sp. YR573 TaxID=1881040 RepID=UPI0008AEEE61|nr:hypothetical protein [Chitinophaga sp. YR573]SEV93447.1 hypothetical protein SAMN05428988_0583 [Chitinophaga sp. YR573]
MKSIKIKSLTKNKQIITDLEDPLKEVIQQAEGIKKIPSPPPPPKGHLHDILKNLKFKNQFDK